MIRINRKCEIVTVLVREKGGSRERGARREERWVTLRIVCILIIITFRPPFAFHDEYFTWWIIHSSKCYTVVSLDGILRLSEDNLQIILRSRPWHIDQKIDAPERLIVNRRAFTIGKCSFVGNDLTIRRTIIAVDYFYHAMTRSVSCYSQLIYSQFVSTRRELRSRRGVCIAIGSQFYLLSSTTVWGS